MAAFIGRQSKVQPFHAERIIVKLSEAKHLASQRHGPFASLVASPEAKPNGVTTEGNRP